MLASTIPLKRLSLVMIEQDAAIATHQLAALEVIHLTSSRQHEVLGAFPGADYQFRYQKLEGRLKKMQRYFSAAIHPSVIEGPTSLQQLEQCDLEIQQLWGTISGYEEKIRNHKETLQQQRQLANTLSRFENLNIDLGWVSGDNPFLALFIGTIPHSELESLQRSLSLADSVVKRFHTGAEHSYILVASEKTHQQDIEEILRSARFHQLSIPPALHDHPGQLRQEIEQQLKDGQEQVTRYRRTIKQLVDAQQALLCNALSLLQAASPFATAASRLSGQGQLVLLEGWVPGNRTSEIEQQLQARLNHPFLLTFTPPTREELEHVPSLQQYPRLLRPFQKLVNQFGVPSYGEVDPTPLFALSYLLMFGMMFGDIGHGAFIILMGLLLRQRIPGLLPFATLAGLSSIFFGALYGSLFGFEHLIPPLWMSPMEDPPQMLLLALVWGIGFLTIAQLLSITNLLATGQYRTALWSDRGMAGLLFFAAGIFAAYRYLEHGQTGALELGAMLLPLSTLLYHHWQRLEGSLSEKVLITLIEGVDKVINNLSSTLSFLRVAAFSLNHVALATAIFTLAAMMEPMGHTITLILGNLFIIILEGGIVAIQCLRLEYYEGFSRFFHGQGKVFQPLRMKTALSHATIR